MAKGKNVVKSTQGMLKLLFIIALVVAWMIAIMTIINDDTIEQQMKLIQEGDLLLEDELYVRAADKYVKAIRNYKTEMNEELEEKLLYIYKDGNLVSQYDELQEQRISEGKAKVEEYIYYAGRLVKEGKVSRAMPILAEGEKQYDNEELTALYESVKYENTVKDFVTTTMKMPGINWIIPAFDGTNWGYINKGDSVILNFKYEETFPFTGSYTVVKKDGGYIVIDTSGNKMAIDKLGLDKIVSMVGDKIVGIKNDKYYLFTKFFEPITMEGFENGYEGIYLNDNGLILIKDAGKWAIYSSSMEPITEFIFEDVVENSRGQIYTNSNAVVKDSKGYYIINDKGQAYFEDRFLEMKGYEGGIVAFKDESQKWGFVNISATEIIKPQYEDAMSFSHHLGAIKYGGEWGYVNRYNTMIIKNDYEEVMPFLNGSALVKNSRGIYSIITLKYYASF